MAAKRSLGSITGQDPRAAVTMMTAVVQHRYGPPQVLAREEMGMPVVGDREVLLRVRAAGLNAGDGFIMRGVPYFLRLFGGLPVPGTACGGWTWPARSPRLVRESPT